jgi:hypothetical protein
LTIAVRWLTQTGLPRFFQHPLLQRITLIPAALLCLAVLRLSADPSSGDTGAPATCQKLQAASACAIATLRLEERLTRGGWNSTEKLAAECPPQAPLPRRNLSAGRFVEVCESTNAFRNLGAIHIRGPPRAA